MISRRSPYARRSCCRKSRCGRASSRSAGSGVERRLGRARQAERGLRSSRARSLTPPEKNLPQQERARFDARRRLPRLAESVHRKAILPECRPRAYNATASRHGGLEAELAARLRPRIAFFGTILSGGLTLSGRGHPDRWRKAASRRIVVGQWQEQAMPQPNFGRGEYRPLSSSAAEGPP